MKRISLLTFAAVLMIAGSGCLKDKGFENQEYGIQIKEVKGISLAEAPNSPVETGLNASTTPQTLTTKVHLEADRPATQDIKVTLVYNPALATAKGYTALPVTSYTAPTTVTIPAGKMSADVNIVIPNASVLNPNNTYGIGIAIATVDPAGYTIAANQKELVLAFSLKNAWDGQYKVLKSQVTDPNRPTISSAPFGTSPQLYVDLITSGANSNNMEWPQFAPPIPGHVAPQTTSTAFTYFGNAQPKFVWDATTNNLTAVDNNLFGPPQNRTYQLIRGNRNPTTKIIVAEYNMIQAGFSPVKHYDSLQYFGPR
jgi:hypothetical protein